MRENNKRNKEIINFQNENEEKFKNSKICFSKAETLAKEKINKIKISENIDLSRGKKNNDWEINAEPSTSRDSGKSCIQLPLSDTFFVDFSGNPPLNFLFLSFSFCQY